MLHQSYSLFQIFTGDGVDTLWEDRRVVVVVGEFDKECDGGKERGRTTVLDHHREVIRRAALSVQESCGQHPARVRVYGEQTHSTLKPVQHFTIPPFICVLGLHCNKLEQTEPS